MALPSPQILIIEPSRTLQRVLESCCAARGATAVFVNTVCEALSAIEKRKPALVMTALELPGFFGGVLVAALRTSPDHRAIPIGLLTSSPVATEQLGPFTADRVLRK